MAKNKKNNSSDRSNSNSAVKAKPARSPKVKSATAVASNRQPGWTNEQIGEMAGAVWQVLTANGPKSLAALKTSVDAPPELILAAIGWLAREGKLDFDTSGRAVKVLLRS